MVSSASKLHNYNQFFSLLIIFISVYAGLCLWGDVNTESIFRVKCIYLLIVDVLYVILWIKKTHKLNSLFFYFLLYFIVTNGGSLFMNGIDWTTEIGSFAFVQYPLDIMNKALDYQLVCTAVFVSTGILLSKRNEVKNNGYKPFKLISEGRFGRIGIVDWLFVSISVIYIILCLSGVAMRSNMNYNDYYYNEDKVSISLLVKYSFYVTMYYSLYSHISNSDVFRNVVLSIDIILAILLLMLGSRNEIIPMIFGIVYVYGRSGYKLSRKQGISMAVYVILFLFIMGLVPLIRQFSVSSLDSSTISNVFSNFGGLLSFMVEMGGSLRTTTETMIMADNSGFKTEPTILYTFLFGIVPSQSLLNLVGFYTPQNWSLATWVTDLNGGGSGWGYSMLAESFYNFRDWGVLWFVAWAFLYTKIENIIDKNMDKGRLTLASSWLYVGSYAIFLARADTCLIAVALRYTMYITIFSYLFFHGSKYSFSGKF